MEERGRGGTYTRQGGRTTLGWGCCSGHLTVAIHALTHHLLPPFYTPPGVMDRPADSGVDVSKRAGWDSDKDGNVATLPPPTDTGATIISFGVCD